MDVMFRTDIESRLASTDCKIFPSPSFDPKALEVLDCTGRPCLDWSSTLRCCRTRLFRGHPRALDRLHRHFEYLGLRQSFQGASTCDCAFVTQQVRNAGGVRINQIFPRSIHGLEVRVRITPLHLAFPSRITIPCDWQISNQGPDTHRLCRSRSDLPRWSVVNMAKVDNSIQRPLAFNWGSSVSLVRSRMLMHICRPRHTPNSESSAIRRHKSTRP